MGEHLIKAELSSSVLCGLLRHVSGRKTVTKREDSQAGRALESNKWGEAPGHWRREEHVEQTEDVADAWTRSSALGPQVLCGQNTATFRGSEWLQEGRSRVEKAQRLVVPALGGDFWAGENSAKVLSTVGPVM